MRGGVYISQSLKDCSGILLALYTTLFSYFGSSAEEDEDKGYRPAGIQLPNSHNERKIKEMGIRDDRDFKL